MRIGMILSTPLPPQEGIGFYVWNLSRHLVDMGHQVQMITRGGAKQITREVIDDFTIWRPSFFPLYPFHVHLHSIFVNKLIRVLEPDLDILHLHSPLVKHPVTKLSSLVTIHSPMKAATASTPTNNLLGWLIKLQTPVSYQLEKQLFKRANKLVAVAQSAVEELRAYDVQPQQVDVLGNGVDTTIFHPSKQHSNGRQPYFLTAGRLGPPKGLEDLIECAAQVVKQFPNHQFYIAGSGPQEQALKAEITRRNLDSHISLLGHINDRAKMVDLYRGATAYVHAAHYEGLPTVVLEAMACGCPVVTTAVSGVLDVIQDDVNGLLVPPKNPTQMAQTIVQLLQKPNLGQQLSEAAYQTIQDRYAWQVVSSNYVAQYESLLSGGWR